jgi:hypothetical protein
VVLDLGAKAPLPIPTQTRLAGLAKKNRTTLVSITRKSHGELGGSLVSLRGVRSARGERQMPRPRLDAPRKLLRNRGAVLNR